MTRLAEAARAARAAARGASTPGPRVHVVGAGMAGLACAVALARKGRTVVLSDAAAQAGGRARSFHDATLDRVIDNGNHLLLSGNRSVFRFLDDIGARDRLVGPRETRFPFLDLTTGHRWAVRLGAGLWPGWVFDPARRVPGTRPRDYLSGLRLARARPEQTVADVLGGAGALYDRFWHPLAVSALNTEAERAQARLLWPVLTETFGRGGRACRPLWARNGLSDTFVDPALETLRTHGGTVRFGRRLKQVESAEGRVHRLVFADGVEDLGPTDAVVLALPPWAANLVLPGLKAPDTFRPIVNLHFRLGHPPPRVMQPLGLLGGTAEWLFLRGDVASVTISAAGHLVDLPPEMIAAPVWPEVVRALGLPPDTPPAPVRVIKEKRATFAQTPGQVARRSGPEGPFRNLLLAGDWTDTGLPATIEGAVRSGHTAAETVLKRHRNP